MKIDRQEFLQELRLRKQIRKAIRVIRERKLTKYAGLLEEEIRLRNLVRRLLKEEGEGDESTGEGIKYKFRITEHINNLLINDSTNVELGISVSLNVNLEELVQQQVQTNDGSELTVPISSVLSPRGTVLHGNNTSDESKRVYLEIYYTCLEEDCDDE